MTLTCYNISFLSVSRVNRRIDYKIGQYLLKMKKEHHNPSHLFPSLQYGFSQIVCVTGGKTVYLSGQVAWDEKQQIVGAGNLKLQTRQALRNIQIALEDIGGSIIDVVSLRIYFLEKVADESHHIGDSLKEFFPPSHAPSTTWVGVPILANPDFLIEIEAIAVVSNE